MIGRSLKYNKEQIIAVFLWFFAMFQLVAFLGGTALPYDFFSLIFIGPLLIGMISLIQWLRLKRTVAPTTGYYLFLNILNFSYLIILIVIIHNILCIILFIPIIIIINLIVTTYLIYHSFASK